MKQLQPILTRLKKVPTVVFMLLVIVLFFSLKADNYFAWSNISNILLQSAPLMILAFGQTLIVLTQGTDLSLGAQVSFTTVMWVLLASKGVPIYLAAIISLVMTMCIGAINGFIIAKGKIPPFIVTLGMQNIINSISLLLTAGASIYFYHPIFQFISDSKILFLPTPIWIAAFVFCLAWVLLHKTKFGINIRGLGGNQEALTFAGINTVVATVKTYAFVGIIAGISGLVTTCRVESGQPIVATGWEFDAVAATLLGGTSLREGKGDLVGTIFGVLLIKVLQNGLNVAGVSTLYHNALIGFVVLSAIVIESVTRLNKEVRS
ncbi:MAG: ABC transporter permease [Sphaerochaeta sp.]